MRAVRFRAILRILGELKRARRGQFSCKICGRDGRRVECKDFVICAKEKLEPYHIALATFSPILLFPLQQGAVACVKDCVAKGFVPGDQSNGGKGYPAA